MLYDMTHNNKKRGGKMMTAKVKANESQKALDKHSEEIVAMLMNMDELKNYKAIKKMKKALED